MVFRPYYAKTLPRGACLNKDRSDVKRRLFQVYRDFSHSFKDLRNKVSGYLSGGEQQVMVIGRSLTAKPE